MARQVAGPGLTAGKEQISSSSSSSSSFDSSLSSGPVSSKFVCEILNKINIFDRTDIDLLTNRTYAEWPKRWKWLAGELEMLLVSFRAWPLSLSLDETVESRTFQTSWLQTNEDCWSIGDLLYRMDYQGQPVKEGKQNNIKTARSSCWIRSEKPKATRVMWSTTSTIHQQQQTLTALSISFSLASWQKKANHYTIVEREETEIPDMSRMTSDTDFSINKTLDFDIVCF